MDDRVLLVQLDGKLPNLALMKLAHYYGAAGAQVELRHDPAPQLGDAPPAAVYGSAIFTKSLPAVLRMRETFPGAVIAGTGVPDALAETVEAHLGVDEYEHYDYSIYPDYRFSIGFNQRGCRLNCGFCVVPRKEGRPRAVNTIADIHRPDAPRAVVLLDNDFFGQPREEWRERIDELREGRYKVNFNQGVNVRLVDDEAAAALASVLYYDVDFKTRRVYTAWDNLGQERIFFDGLARLTGAGIPARHVMVYMLIGYAKGETMDDILHRFDKLVEAGVRPYPMVYNDQDQGLKAFQRWAVRRYYEHVPWEDYRRTFRPETARALPML